MLFHKLLINLSVGTASFTLSYTIESANLHYIPKTERYFSFAGQSHLQLILLKQDFLILSCYL